MSPWRIMSADRPDDRRGDAVADGVARPRTNGPPRRANLFGIDLLGRALIISLNYERYVTPRVGLGVGVGSGGGDDELIIPLYVSLNPIGPAHSLYAGAGASVEWGRYSSDAWGTVTVGYEYRGKDRMVARLTLNGMFDRESEGVFLWPGFMFGARF